MGRSLNTPDAGNTVINKLSVPIGGLDTTTAPAALTALNGVPAALLGQPNGVAQLTEKTLLDPNILPVVTMGAVSVIGPTSLSVSTPGTFNIKDFDSFISYTLTVIGTGSISRVDNIITYTPPATPGAYGFYLNGKKVPVTVV